MRVGLWVINNLQGPWQVSIGSTDLRLQKTRSLLLISSHFPLSLQKENKLGLSTCSHSTLIGASHLSCWASEFSCRGFTYPQAPCLRFSPCCLKCWWSLCRLAFPSVDWPHTSIVAGQFWGTGPLSSSKLAKQSLTLTHLNHLNIPTGGKKNTSSFLIDRVEMLTQQYHLNWGSGNRWKDPCLLSIC